MNKNASTAEQAQSPEGVSSGDALGYIAIEIGAEAVGSYNEALQKAWNDRPICCGKKTDNFDDIAWICSECDAIFDY